MQAKNDLNGFKFIKKVSARGGSAPGGKKGPTNNREMIKSFILYGAISLVLVSILYTFAAPANPSQEKSFSQVLTEIKAGQVKKIEVAGDTVAVFLKDGSQFHARKEAGSSLVEAIQKNNLDPSGLDINIKDDASSSRLFEALINILPVALMVGFFLMLMRQARGASDSMFSFGKSRAKLFNKDKPKMNFADVAGVDEAKKELSEIVEFLKEPEKFRRLGARSPKGVLLVGPAGVGKTLLARALAGEANVPFFSMAGSEFMEMLVGVGASRVRDLFDTAKKSAPAIIFIDEIESIGRRRGMGMAGGHDEREQTLNQILVEMDGFEPNTSVIVVAASVVGETPVLVKKNGLVELKEIREIIDPYFFNDLEQGEKVSSDLEILGFDNLPRPRNNVGSYFGNSAFKKVRSVFRHRVKEIYEIEYLGGKMRTTGNHSVFIRTRRGVQPKAVADLKPGDCLVDIPYVVNRTEKKRRQARAHRFETVLDLELPVYEPLFGKQSDLEAAYDFAVVGQGKISQTAIGAAVGFSQTTISNWQRGGHRPRALSREYFNHQLPETVRLSPELTRLFGYYAAEGYARKELDFCFSLKEGELGDDLKQLMVKVFGLLPDRVVRRRSAANFVYYSKPLAEFFGHYVGQGAHQKHVPAFLFEAPREYFVEFFRGYFNGDGHKDKQGRLEITSVSRRLVTELNWLARMHGFKSYVGSFTAKEGRRVNGGKPLKAVVAWRLGFGKTQNPLEPEERLGKVSIKRPRVRSIRKVEYDGYVYDFCGCDNEAFFGGVTPLLLHNTNRPDLLDSALVRPGRFDRQVRLDLPDLAGRQEILKIHLKGKPVAVHVDLAKLAKRTVGFSGADLENMLNEAAILAAREGKKEIESADMEEAATKVKLGPEKRRLQSEEDKKMTAYHEAGHALVSALQPHMDPVHRISIVSRGLALGYTMIPPSEDRYNETKTRFLEQVTTMLGGRAAEEIVFSEFTAGAGNDIESATRLARAMVSEYGMSELGPMAFAYQDEDKMRLSMMGELTSYSEDMARKIDLEVKRIIDEAHQKAKRLLSENREKLDAVVAALLEKETLEGGEFERIIGKTNSSETNLIES